MRSDAAKTGYVAVILRTGNNKQRWRMAGWWGGIQEGWHINYQELYVLYLVTLWLVEHNMTGRLVWTGDNTVALQYAKQLGGRVPMFHQLIQSIHRLMCANRLELVGVRYVCTSRNLVPDHLSRLPRQVDEPNSRNEFESFITWVRVYQPQWMPSLHMFTTRQLRLLASYGSEYEDIGSEGSFFDSPLGQMFYAKPPKEKMAAVLEHMRVMKASGWLNVTVNTQATWWPMLQQHTAKVFWVAGSCPGLKQRVCLLCF